ncbi:type VI secretion system baseplate subunit TssK [Polyangium sp. 15x6]|uniref:type VI secretion system baseplate subunit TssK n=1 Tax=Polyangium sp. 15x6 TaxID=3042687 RepID=UPI00249B7CA6|nr:type VI secretion system baseplate subunit TssK [Polyangium sp. 15x6]MDI3289186.1 type VI secretion system baseplate subunit TssK [Polyangium sp. 15x6]
MRADEIPLAIQWHDGMLLSPQHFQEADRRSERLLAYHLQQASPYHHGIVTLKLAEGTLGSGLLRVQQIEAIMPDGTLVHHAGGKHDLSVDLRPQAALVRDAPATVFLAVPRAQAAVSASAADLARNRSAEGAPVVDEHTGEDPLEIPRIAPSVRLLVAAEPPPRLVCLPIAQVRLEGEAFVATDYIPPTLGVAPGSPLDEMCQRLAGRLREKAMRLAEKANFLSRTTDRELIGEIRRQIQCLVAALPPFEAVLYSERPHPFSLFVTLTGLVGQISSLARTPVPPLLPKYRHDDLRATFENARDHIFRMVDEGIIESFTAYPFDLKEGKYNVLFQREFRTRAVVLAVRAQRGVREDQLLNWMNGALIGAPGRLRTMQESRILGAGRKRVERHGDLVATPGTLLFELEEQSVYLDPGEPLTLCNTADPTGQSGPSEAVLYVKSG